MTPLTGFDGNCKKNYLRFAGKWNIFVLTAPDTSMQRLTSTSHMERLSIVCWTRPPDSYSLGSRRRMSSSLEPDPRDDSFEKCR
jgi:hypothetical protein